MGSFVAARGLLSSCGSRAPEHLGSVIAAPRLSCPEACGILVPQPGIEPASLPLENRFLTTGPPVKSLGSHFLRQEIFQVCCCVPIASHEEIYDLHPTLSDGKFDGRFRYCHPDYSFPMGLVMYLLFLSPEMHLSHLNIFPLPAGTEHCH